MKFMLEIAISIAILFLCNMTDAEPYTEAVW